MKIYNSLSRKKEEFSPVSEGKIGMYVCGPTVYDSPHIGHARSAYIFDVIRRYFEYKNYKVKFVRNVTDVDDKIIEKSKKAAAAPDKIAEKYLAEYHNDMELLGIRKPDFEPRATEYIPKMIKFIALLIERGAAYAAGGDVYFDIKKAKDYGKLSNQNIEKMETGARAAPGEKKKDPLDFALWKSAREGEPSWPSPWGQGRPGWHIECSVMSSDTLGDEFDIHGGGIDLIFPHHENEIAQSEGAGNKFARYWIHHGLLTIDSEKMAKSLGNFISIKDFLAKHKDPDYLKLFFLSAHYSSPVDYAEEKILEAKKGKERFLILLEKIDKGKEGKIRENKGDGKEIERFRKRFEDAMDDDFNTPAALAVLFDLVTYTNKNMALVADARKLIVELSGVLGLKLSEAVFDGLMPERWIRELVCERDKARSSRDYGKSDDIRKKLLDRGIILEDAKDGTTKWRRKI